MCGVDGWRRETVSGVCEATQNVSATECQAAVSSPVLCQFTPRVSLRRCNSNIIIIGARRLCGFPRLKRVEAERIKYSLVILLFETGISRFRLLSFFEVLLDFDLIL